MLRRDKSAYALMLRRDKSAYALMLRRDKSAYALMLRRDKSASTKVSASAGMLPTALKLRRTGRRDKPARQVGGTSASLLAFHKSPRRNHFPPKRLVPAQE
jgi:hypothetical protein